MDARGCCHSSFVIDLRSSLLTLGKVQASLTLLSLNRSLHHSSFLKKLPSFHFGDFSLEDKRWLVVVVVVLTFVFGYYSFQTSFDPNISHINYMTAEQKADMAYFQEVMAQNTTLRKVYVVSPDSTMDGALDHSRQRQPALRQLQAQGLVVGQREQSNDHTDDDADDYRQKRCLDCDTESLYKEHVSVVGDETHLKFRDDRFPPGIHKYTPIINKNTKLRKNIFYYRDLSV